MRFLLLPFSWLYGLITDFRNFCYNNQLFSVTSFRKPIINIGNLTVGGTGKSPHVEYLVKLLHLKYKIVILSRGYGRKTKGFLVANQSANATTIGDEPMQFYQKFSPEVQITVGEKRVEALQKIFEIFPSTDIVILDDAFQHRAVKPNLNILLMDYNRPIYQDFTFPAGRLRERRRGASRAEILVVSKCPDDLSASAQSEIIQKISPYLTEKVLVFFSGIRYGAPKLVNQNIDFTFNQTLLLVSGIANPAPFEKYCKEQFKVKKHIIYKDHHHFTEQDFIHIVNEYNDIQDVDKSILMTEKDMVKFQTLLGKEQFKTIPFFYLPIEIYFLNQANKVFDDLIENQCKNMLKSF